MQLAHCWPTPPYILQAYGYSALAVTVGALAARSRELAGRSFWASLHSVARAQSKQAAAERREQLVALKREAADARSEAVGAVMRYVCHELRNPLHGIIVRSDEPPPSKRVSPPSPLTHPTRVAGRTGTSGWYHE